MDKNREDLFGVFFIDENRGWVCGRWGTILSTTDGGNLWTVQSSGTDITLGGIHFSDSDHGWAVGEKGIILHTEDGGKNWIRQKSPVDNFLMSVFFVDPKTGWIAGEASHILHTQDGGENWRVQFSNNEYMLKKIAFQDAKTGWAVGEYGFIYHTTDGGINWIQKAGHFSFSSETFQIQSGSTLFDIALISEQKAIAVGIAGTVIKTEDGGATWNTIPVAFQINKPIFAVATANHGNSVVVAGKDTFAVSTDGGSSFKKCQSVPDIECRGWIYKIAPRGHEGFVGVGKEGSIYRSTLTADRWTQVGMETSDARKDAK